MSGAEALFAVGIICNAMQIITFGKDSLHVYRSIRDNGAPDPRLESYLDLAAKGYKSLGDRSRGPRPLTNDQQQIFDLSEKAYKSLEAFQSKFQELHLDMQSRKGLVGSLRAVKAGFKTLVNDKELKGLEKDFQRYEQLFQAHLIQRVCSQSNASALLTQETFSRLDATQQEVVTKLAEGHTNLCDLLSRESVLIKNHVQKQHLETRADTNKGIHAAECHIVSHIAESSSKVQHEFALQRQDEDDKKRHQQLLASLRYPEMNARKNQIATNFPNTCRWIFKTARSLWTSSLSSTDGDHGDSSDNWSEDATSDNQDQIDTTALEITVNWAESASEEPTPFVRWLMSDSGMFWISGKPASGKSTLMKFIATSRLTRDNLEVWRPSVQILTHYFWKPGSKMEKSLRGMLLSLTHQVLLDRLDLIRWLWEEPKFSFVRHRWSHADWALKEIEDVLFKVVEVSNDAFFIMIDGLDESSEFEQYFSMPYHDSNVLDRLMQLKNVKICASSREENTFCRFFERVESLRIHELTKYDIREFANSRLNALNLANSWERDLLLNQLTLSADGVFLWVSLVLDSIARACRLTNDIQTLIERVKHAPRDIMKLFQDIWERSGDDGDVASYREYNNLHGIAQRAQSFLVLAMASENRDIESMLRSGPRITTTDLLDRCLKVEQELSITCCGLLEVSDRRIYLEFNEVPDSLMHYDKKSLRFVHRCAIDYLTDTESGAAILGACRWSKEEPIARLFGGYMVRGRFFETNTFSSSFSHIANRRQHLRPRRVDTCLDALLDCVESGVFAGSSWPEFFIRTWIKWQLAGVFQQQYFWSYPGRPVYVTNPLEIEFLEITANKCTLLTLFGYLSELSAQQFLDSIPAIVRGLTERTIHDWEHTVSISVCISVTRFILTRLLDLNKEEGVVSSTEARALCKDTNCRLWSWFFMTVVGDVKAKPAPPFSDILQLFTAAIPDIEDWHRPLPLYLWRQQEPWPEVKIFHPRPLGDWEHFVIVNFATAYRISSSICGGQGLVPEQIPDFIMEVQPCFQPIVFQREGAPLFYAIWPDQQDELGAQLMASILGADPSSDAETSLSGDGMPFIGKGSNEIMRYLIDTVGHMDDMPVHSWWPGWEIRGIDEELSIETRLGSKE
ncbi:Ff.00g013890.m01.CDS01 [Fusarium sp. VM40]|nr:Ff.00g013890.m01.CDS01 [Fusarium sp. VM40]